MVSAVPFPNDVPYTNVLDSAKAGADYASKLFENAKERTQFGQQQRSYQAQMQAGKAFQQGDSAGVVNALAGGGDIAGAQAAQTYGQGQAGYQADMIGRSASFIQHYYELNGKNPQAALQAFQYVAPQLQAAHVPDAVIQHFGQGLQTNPDATIQGAQAFAAKQLTWHEDGQNLYATDQYGQVVGQPIPKVQAPYKLGAQEQEVTPPNPLGPGAATSPQADSASAGALIPSVDPNAVQQVESGGDPNAVSSAGAVGPMQTMPTTLTKPGFGVAPAANNSDAERTRVGRDYLAAMGRLHGPVGSLIANNMGPGAFDEWLKKGGNFNDLPKETQLYLGKVAVQQAFHGQQGNVQVASNGPVSLPSQGVSQDAGASVDQIHGGGIQRTVMPDGTIVTKNTASKFTAGSPEDQANGILGYDEYHKPILMTPGQMQMREGQTLKNIVNQNPDLKGPALLAKVSPDIADWVRGVDEGRIQISPRTFSQPGMEGRAALVSAYDPGFDMTKYYQRNAEAKSLTNQGTLGKQIVASGTALQHLGLLRDLIGALKNGNINAINQAKNAWVNATGGPAPSTFDEVGQFASAEVSKAAIGGVGGEEERGRLGKVFGADRSPQSLLSNINTATQLLGAGVNSRAALHEKIMGPNAPPLISYVPAEIQPYIQSAMSAGRMRGNGASPRGGQVVRTYNPKTGKLE